MILKDWETPMVDTSAEFDYLLLFLKRGYKVVFKVYITYLKPLENGQCESLPKRPPSTSKKELTTKKTTIFA